MEKTHDSNTRAEFVLIVDSSGSMYDLKDDVIGGVNSVIDEASENPNAKMSLVFFDTELKWIYESEKANDISKISSDDYAPGGMTALLDAVGESIARVSANQDKLGEDEKASKILVTIITDGYENASKEFSYDQVRNMITSKEKGVWEFVFMGANIDAAKEAGKFGISSDRAAKWSADVRGMKAASAVLRRTVGSVNCGEELREEGFFEEIENDWKSRS